ncbi:reverse transcriptase domain-containing protein [Tanacetum coccineum]
MTPPLEKETLYAYLAVSTEAISIVLLTDRKGRQCPVQYVSRTLNEAEINYAPMEKLALSLVHMTRRLRRYFEAHLVKVITDQPIKSILNNTETSRKLAKYAVELGAYNIKFIPRNAIPVEKDDTKSWTLFTDGASSLKGSGAGLVLTGPNGIEYTYALRLTFPSTNNEAKYEALLAGLRIARQMNISNIEAKVDSKLVASQINGSYEASKDNMIKYLAKEKEYASRFKSFPIENIPRNMNQKEDVLSRLASVAFNYLTKEVLVEVLNKRSTESHEVHTIVEEEGDNWMTPIIQCLKEGIWPKDKNKARCLRAKISQYTVESRVLFKKGYLVPMLRFGLPRIIVTDNGAQLVNDPFKRWSLMEGIKTRLGREKAGWVDEFPNVLWAHQTSIKQSNGETPFSLTYGSEAVIAAEIGIPTYRTLMIREDYNEE